MSTTVVFGMVLQQALVSQETSDQVLRGVCPVDADDELLGSPTLNFRADVRDLL
jgi:hypothetical protein